MSQTAWNGEGLPPRGTVCEFFKHDEGGTCWHSELPDVAVVEIIAHFNAGGDQVAAFVFEVEGGKQVEQAVAKCFRPIHTPEQIAPEARLHSILNACTDIADTLDDLRGKTKVERAALRVVEAMIDAGYRKPKGGAA